MRLNPLQRSPLSRADSGFSTKESVGARKWLAAGALVQGPFLGHAIQNNSVSVLFVLSF